MVHVKRVEQRISTAVHNMIRLKHYIKGENTAKNVAVGVDDVLAALLRLSYACLEDFRISSVPEEEQKEAIQDKLLDNLFGERDGDKK